MDVAVAPYVDANVPRSVEDVARLGFRQGELLALGVLAFGVSRDRDPRLAVAVLGEAAAVQADARRRPAPHVGDPELAVGCGNHRVRRKGPRLQVLHAHPVEPVEVVGLQGGLEALDVARARRPPRVLEPFGHLVRIVVRYRLAYERVVGVAASLQKDAAPKADALGVADEADEVGGDGDLLAAVLLAGPPGALASDLLAQRVRARPLHAEEVVVLGRQAGEVVPLPRLDDDLGERASCRVPVLLLAGERLLDHLVGYVRGKSLERGF